MSAPSTSPTKYAEPYATAIERLEKGWTQGSMARTATGEGVSSESRLASCWCLEGAFCAMPPNTIYRVVRSKMGETSPWRWNDHWETTQSEVLALVREAAEIDGAVLS